MLDRNLSLLFALLISAAFLLAGCQMAPTVDRVNPVASYVRTVE